MAKRIAFILVAALAATSFPGSAGAADRKDQGTYASPAAGAGGVGVAGCAEQDAPGCVILNGGPETSISVKIVDQTGGEVAASVTQDTNDDGQADSGTDICTQTTSPVSIQPHVDVNVFIFTGPCIDGTPASATTGTVTGTFHGSGGGGGGGGGGKLPSASARLSFSDSTPERGVVFKAIARLGVCKGHAGTKILLQKKTRSGFRKVAGKKLSKKCKAVFRVKANFKKRTFRSLWPKQDANHRKSASKAKTVTTH